MSVTAVRRDRARKRVPYSEGGSVLDEVVEHRVGEQPEDQIIEAEDGQPAPWDRLGAGGQEQRRGRLARRR